MLSMSLRTDTYASSALLFSVVSLSTYIIIKALTGSKRNGLPLPPSLPSVPILGSFPFIRGMNDLPRFFTETSLKLGPVFGLTIGKEYVVVLNTKEIIYEALIKKSAAFSGRQSAYTVENYTNPKRFGIISKQYGPYFRKLHQIVLSVLKEFGFGMRLMQERILVEVEELIELLQESGPGAINPIQMMTVCTLNVIASITFGQRISQRDSILARIAHCLHIYVQGERRKVDICPSLRHLPKFRAAIEESLSLQREQLEFIEQQVEASLKSERDSFVKRVVQQIEKDEHARDELNYTIRDLLLAGSDTTSTTVQFAMIRMANHPEVLKRVHKELDSVLDHSGLVTLEDTSRMPYVEATILEVIRHHAVVPLALPHCTLEDAELAGYFIPKGTMVFPNLHSAHMDSNVWKDPETFLPERFLDEEGNVKGKDMIIPFSLGKRSCLGELLARQEIFLIITNLLHTFNILPPEGQDKVIFSENYLVTSFPNPFQLRFIPRK